MLKNERLNVLSLSEKAFKEVQIMDSFGKKIKFIENTGFVLSFPTHDLNTGIYLIEATFEDNTKLIKKFVIQ